MGTVEQLSDSSLIPTDYTLPGAAMDIFFEDEEEPFGAKEIVSIVIICLIVIGGVIGCRYFYKKKQKSKVQQQTFDKKSAKLSPPSYSNAEMAKKEIEMNTVRRDSQPAAIATPKIETNVTTPDTKFIQNEGNENAYAGVKLETIDVQKN